MHERLYRSSEKQREKNQDDIDNEYAKSRIAQERRPAEEVDGRESGFFSVDGDEYYGFGDEREPSPPRVATQRTNALYLEVRAKSLANPPPRNTIRTCNSPPPPLRPPAAASLFLSFSHSLKASLRRARREEKAAQVNPECSFQPALYRNSRSTDRSGYNEERGRNRSRNRAYSVDRGQSQSRHELLYNDGERKRIKNLEAKNDPNQVGG